MVFTNYKPITHDLTQLYSELIEQNERSAEVFSQDTEFHGRRFQLLKRACVDARYSE